MAYGRDRAPRRRPIGGTLLAVALMASLLGGGVPARADSALEDWQEAPSAAGEMLLAGYEPGADEAEATFGATTMLELPAAPGVDIRHNDPTTDAGEQTTQSETALVADGNIVCAGFNDFGPNGLSGWARSTDGGSTWTDMGGLNERGDPVLAHHQGSDTFYYASLGNTSIRINRSTDDCQTWGAAVNASTPGLSPATTLADKPWIAIDNTGSASDGDVYVCWTRFFTGGSELRFSRSTDGGANYGNEQILAASGTAPFGCSVQVAPDGSVNLVWADRSNSNILLRRSTDGGINWSAAATVNSGTLRQPGTDTIVNCSLNPMTNPNNRPTLTGNIRMLHQAWMAIDTSGGANDGNIYVVYATDPAGTPDNSDVFFARSTDNGANWSAQVQIGGGGGATDQFEPNVAVSGLGTVGIVWYDRRNDTANNTNIDVYTNYSTDGGVNFSAIERVTDVSFGVPPIFPMYDTGAAQCYMGEYIAIAAQAGRFYYSWGDNRNTIFTTNFPAPNGRLDPDVYFDTAPDPANTPPAVTVDAASGNEGSGVSVTGTVTDPDNPPGDFTYSWTATPAATDAGASCLIANGTTLNPTVTCSDDGTYTLTLTATGDPAGPVSGSNTLTLSNVAPDVTTDTGLVTTINEGDSFTMGAGFTDPGWNDTYSATIDFGTGSSSQAATLNVTVDGPPSDQGTVGGSHQYGDDGLFTVTATVSDDDTGSDSDTVSVTVGNVDPTADIGTAGTTNINGTPTFLTQVGVPVDFSGRSTDPGSDDLTLTWDWDDGAPVPDVSTTSLVNPPASDPDPSPSVQPRDVTDNRSHAFTGACRYDIVFASTDDDGGNGSDSAVVIIVGDNVGARTHGYWKTEMDGRRNADHTAAELACLLDITAFMSQVFNEVVDASTPAKAAAVLDTSGKKDAKRQLDTQLLAVWLNFADGRIGYDQLVDTNFDGSPDTAFSVAIANAEEVRLNPISTQAQLLNQKDILEDINRG